MTDQEILDRLESLQEQFAQCACGFCTYCTDIMNEAYQLPDLSSTQELEEAEFHDDDTLPF